MKKGLKFIILILVLIVVLMGAIVFSDDISEKKEKEYVAEAVDYFSNCLLNCPKDSLDNNYIDSNCSADCTQSFILRYKVINFGSESPMLPYGGNHIALPSCVSFCERDYTCINNCN